MKTKLSILAVALMAGGSLFAQPRVSVGIGIGGYAPGYNTPPAYDQQYVPPCPGPGYEWVDGYWAPQGGRNVWMAGFWRAPYVTNYRVAPHYYSAPRYSNSFRDNDHDRDHGSRNQFRGNERNDNHNQGRGNPNGSHR